MMPKKRKARKSAAKRASKHAASKKAKAAPRKTKKAAKRAAKKPAQKKRASPRKRGTSAAAQVQTEIVDVIEEIAPGIVKVTEIETVDVTVPDANDRDVD